MYWYPSLLPNQMMFMSFNSNTTASISGVGNVKAFWPQSVCVKASFSWESHCMSFDLWLLIIPFKLSFQVLWCNFEISSRIMVATLSENLSSLPNSPCFSSCRQTSLPQSLSQICIFLIYHRTCSRPEWVCNICK